MNPAVYCWWWMGIQTCSGVGSPAHAPFYDPPYNPPPHVIASTAPDACDFEHQCYHMDPAHPDRVTPPPTPQYPPPHALAPTPTPERACHVILMRHPPEPVYQAVEICALTPDKEAAIRAQMDAR